MGAGSARKAAVSGWGSSIHARSFAVSSESATGCSKKTCCKAHRLVRSSCEWAVMVADFNSMVTGKGLRRYFSRTGSVRGHSVKVEAIIKTG